MKKTTVQGAKKVIFTACHSGELKLTFTSPNDILTSPKIVLMSRLISQFFCNLNSSEKFTCPSGKLITEFTSPIAKSTIPGLSGTTFFVRCSHTIKCLLNELGWAGRENIWYSVRPSDLEQIIFLTVPPTQSVSTYMCSIS